jgi:pimeloyl-ACP methyl ester carboxylesterase
VRLVAGIVLVHGAHVGSWCWDHVAPELRERGHLVETVDLHRGSLVADTIAAQEIVDKCDGSVVACGWSYGGVVITGLRLRPGSHLVYLCAFMPDVDETSSSLTEHHPTGFGTVVGLDEAGELVLAGDEVDEYMWADAAPDRARSARALLQGQAIAPLLESPRRVAWRETPSTFVVCRQDRVVHPDLQRAMAQRADERIEWDASHSPMLSRPELVVDLLDRLAS